MQYRKVKTNDFLAVFWRLLVLITIEIVTAIYFVELEKTFWWLLILFGLIIWIVNWHCHYFGYECVKCGHKQQISIGKEFLSLNLINRKYLKCEKCKKWSCAQVLVIKK